MSPDRLFLEKGELKNFLQQREDRLKKEVYSYDSNYILNVSEEDFCQYLISQYSLDTPHIHEDKIKAYYPEEVDVNVSRAPKRIVIDRSRPFAVKGTQVTIVLPFEGDGELFQYKPSTYTPNPPRGKIEEQEIHLIYQLAEYDTDKLKQIYQRDLNLIKRYLEWVRRDVENF